MAQGRKQGQLGANEHKLLVVFAATGLGLGLVMAFALTAAIVYLLTHPKPSAVATPEQVAQRQDSPAPTSNRGEERTDPPETDESARAPEPATPVQEKTPEAAAPVNPAPPATAPPAEVPPKAVPVPPAVPRAAAETPPLPVAVPAPIGPSPLNQLDPAKVDAGERSSVPANWPVVAIVPGQSDLLTGVAFSPDGRRLATTCRDGTLRLFDLTQSAPAKLLDVKNKPAPAGSPTFSPGGTSVAFASVHGVTIYDVSGPLPARRTYVRGCTISTSAGKNPCPEQVLAFYPDGKTLCVSLVGPRENSPDKTPKLGVNIWNLVGSTQRLMGILDGPAQTPGQAVNDHCIALAPDLCLAHGGELKTLSRAMLTRAGNPAPGPEQDISGVLVGMAFSPDGKTLAYTTRDGSVGAVTDSAKDAPARLATSLGMIKAHDGWSTVVTFAADGKSFVSRGEDRLVVWWELAPNLVKGREWRSPEGCQLWRFSPDGHYAVLAVSGERLAIVRLTAPFQLP